MGVNPGLPAHRRRTDSMPAIRLEHVDKVFPNGHVAVRGLDLTVEKGELLVLVGPSGCGKTTTLRIIAGLEAPSAGHVFIDDHDVSGLAPRERDLAMVFQHHALYPHMTVRRNLEFGLRMRRTPRAVISERVGKVAQSLGIEPLLDRMPAQLSGGEQQRVALGRAIVRQPRAFLLDEPLSNLDVQLRVGMRTEIRELQRRLGVAMLYVTHDQEEAMTLGDRIAVMRDGALQQVGPPLEVYRQPANQFVAGFIGSPAMNFFPCRVVRDGARTRLTSAHWSIELEQAPPVDADAEVILGVRPHDVSVVERGREDVVGVVDIVQPLGNETLVCAVLEPGGDKRTITAVVPAVATPRAGECLPLRLTRNRLHFFRATDGASIR